MAPAADAEQAAAAAAKEEDEEENERGRGNKSAADADADADSAVPTASPSVSVQHIPGSGRQRRPAPFAAALLGLFIRLRDGGRGARRALSQILLGQTFLLPEKTEPGS